MKVTFSTGPFLTLSVNRTDETVRVLEQAGFQCHRDEKLIRQPCGYLLGYSASALTRLAQAKLITASCALLAECAVAQS